MSPAAEAPVGTQVLTDKPALVFKYIDDILTSEKLNFGDTVAVMKDGVLSKTKQPFQTQNGFRSISSNPAKLAMVVNSKKTGLLCVSDAFNYCLMVYITDEEGNKIKCAKELKVLGFTFSSRQTVKCHVMGVVKHMRQRTWALRHLAWVGFLQGELVQVYSSLLLPIADYCAPAYHSLLTGVQGQQLEGAQTWALRAIFGYGKAA